MVGRLATLLAVAFIVHSYRQPLVLDPSASARPPVKYVEQVIGEMASTMLVVLAAWLVAVFAAAVLRNAPGALGRVARRAWRILVPATLRVTAVTLVGATVAMPAQAMDEPSAMPVAGRPVTTEQVVERPASSAPSAPRASSPTGPAGSSPAQAGVRRPDTVTVRTGDCLWSIAARHLGGSPTVVEVAEHWPRWYAANRATIGPDPNVILAGMLLRAPASESAAAAGARTGARAAEEGSRS